MRKFTMQNASGHLDAVEGIEYISLVMQFGNFRKRLSGRHAGAPTNDFAFG
jgi:hypothetical protein